eukprot:13121921-Heterocapsa_arctica.AAC.1
MKRSTTPAGPKAAAPGARKVRTNPRIKALGRGPGQRMRKRSKSQHLWKSTRRGLRTRIKE